MTLAEPILVPAPSSAPARGLRIAMIGQRGVPATYGGVEHHVEEIGARLAARGHDVTVYCRTNYGDDQPAHHRGMRLRHLPTLPTKHFEAIAHSGVCSLAALAARHDIVHYHAIGPGLAAPLPRAFSGARVVLTVHGLDDERAKWGRAARSVLRSAQWMSARVPHTTIVVSRALAEHYAHRHDCSTVYIPNGVNEPTSRPAGAIRELFGLEAGRYLLFVGRLVQEKSPDLLIRAFRRLNRPIKLVIAGGSSYSDGYVRELERLAGTDSRVILPGYVYGDLKDELYSNAAAFVLPSALEGLPLTLLEAASYGTPVVASDIPPHLEVLGSERPGQRLFRSGDELELAAALDRALSDPRLERGGAARLRHRVLRSYQWDEVTEATEAVYLGLTVPAGRELDLTSAERPRRRRLAWSPA